MREEGERREESRYECYGGDEEEEGREERERDLAM